jgi:hypothetical protein
MQKVGRALRFTRADLGGWITQNSYGKVCGDSSPLRRQVPKPATRSKPNAAPLKKQRGGSESD